MIAVWKIIGNLASDEHDEHIDKHGDDKDP